ncbi:hypothetical protein [Streptomyces sp. HUAS ZL42]|uniref:hypothetical protein n=1 Tax=Streptomyces sp. HUAS ZL42 TaxID=3231715 RepID=UPI00345EAE3B
MSDSPTGSLPTDPGRGSGPGPSAPDFLDRLIARHAAPVTEAVRVRPRLPGPFERAEAVRARAPEPDGADPLLWPSATPSSAPERDAPRPAAATPARLHTERERTVVRTEREPGDQGRRSAVPELPEAPLLRPSAPLAPGPRPAAESPRRTPGRGRAEPGPDRTAVSVPTPPGTDTAPPASAPVAARPAAADTAAAREAARQAAARRPARAPEQVVQVQIGRLEVTAAPTAGPTRQRPPAAGRPGATVSLAEYLARGRE